MGLVGCVDHIVCSVAKAQELYLVCSSIGAMLGAYVGALPIPLDWDRPWQVRQQSTYVLDDTLFNIVAEWLIDTAMAVDLCVWHVAWPCYRGFSECCDQRYFDVFFKVDEERLTHEC